MIHGGVKRFFVASGKKVVKGVGVKTRENTAFHVGMMMQKEMAAGTVKAKGQV
jgi:hypothetical protein